MPGSKGGVYLVASCAAWLSMSSDW